MGPCFSVAAVAAAATVVVLIIIGYRVIITSISALNRTQMWWRVRIIPKSFENKCEQQQQAQMNN